MVSKTNYRKCGGGGLVRDIDSQQKFGLKILKILRIRFPPPKNGGHVEVFKNTPAIQVQTLPLEGPRILRIVGELLPSTSEKDLLRFDIFGATQKNTYLPSTKPREIYGEQSIGGNVVKPRFFVQFQLDFLSAIHRHFVGYEFLWHSGRAGHAPCFAEQPSWWIWRCQVDDEPNRYILEMVGNHNFHALKFCVCELFWDGEFT